MEKEVDVQEVTNAACEADAMEEYVKTEDEAFIEKVSEVVGDLVDEKEAEHAKLLDKDGNEIKITAEMIKKWRRMMKGKAHLTKKKVSRTKVKSKRKAQKKARKKNRK